MSEYVCTSLQGNTCEQWVLLSETVWSPEELGIDGSSASEAYVFGFGSVMFWLFFAMAAGSMLSVIRRTFGS